MEIDYKRRIIDGELYVDQSPRNVYSGDEGNKCCLTCKHAERLRFNGPGGIGCWHASDECGEPDHRWCISYGDRFRCTDWLDKDAKVTPEIQVWCCRCDWKDYFDFRIIGDYGNGHVRVSFYPDQIIISDLFVHKEKRRKRLATALLDYVDELVLLFGDGKKVTILALEDWEKEWYERRGYEVIEENG